MKTYISSVDCHTRRISKFVDHYLQPAVINLKSYVKATTEFIKRKRKVNNKIDDSYLVSLDVRSLYTNIPHIDSIEAVRKSLQKSKLSISISIVITLLKLILTLNNFVFDGVNYLQKESCAVGTRCAHSCCELIYRLV